jgi:hypothetical protein
MLITQADIEEVDYVVSLKKQVEALSIDDSLKIIDKIFHQQPFVCSFLIGYQHDTTPDELQEIIMMYLLIWKYFSAKKNLKAIEITQQQYETIEKRQIEMLKYTQDEPDELEKTKIYEADIAMIKSKALYSSLFYNLNTKPVLLKMKSFNRAMILIGLKSIIECFENLKA